MRAAPPALREMGRGGGRAERRGRGEEEEEEVGGEEARVGRATGGGSSLITWVGAPSNSRAANKYLGKTSAFAIATSTG